MTPLGREIAERVAADGPIDVARYMALCLGHPVHGYYATRDPFGARGDFVTAPEISQMFGELLGLWAAEVWTRMGSPDRVALIELGPGRGTLMADALRAAKALPAFREAVEVTLVETSPTLKAVQERTLEGAGAPVRWATTVEEALAPLPRPGRSAAEGRDRAPDETQPFTSPQRGEVNRRSRAGEGAEPYPERTRPPHPALRADLSPPGRGEERRLLPALPVLVLANEFFDALPVRQFVRTDRGWRERMVGLGPGGALAFGLAGEPPADVRLPERPNGFVLELNPEAIAIAARLGGHVAQHGGAVLAIDYGEAASAGDTLQALRAHAFSDPLAEPGEADLTTQVDFGALARAASAAGAAAAPLIAQADLLERLGLEARAARLKRSATPEQAAAIDAAAVRLTDRTPAGMGALFKALCFAHPGLGTPPAFESA